MSRFLLLTLASGLALLAMMVAAPHDGSALFRPSAALAIGETCSPARPHASGTVVKTVSTPGGTRSYRLHVPASYTGVDPVPVVLAFHGAHSSALEQEIYSAFSLKSDAEGFIVAYPEGKPATITFSHFNAWQLATPEPNDVAFTGALLDAVESLLCIDQSRVYSTGISNGAMMSVRLACSLSSRIAAIGPVAGAYYPADAMFINPAETCPDTAVRPVIAFHGTADGTVPFNGGGSVGYRLPLDDNTPAEDVMSDWAAHDGCIASRQESQIDTEVRLIAYGSCADGALVQLYAVDGGGHTWPGSFDVPSLGYVTQQIDATDLIWSFFSAYALPDADADLIPDGSDNCLIAPNFSQQNTDRNFIDNSPPYAATTDDKTLARSDGLGDACDTDDDNDGIADTIEIGGPPCATATGPTDPWKLDTDSDRVTDGAECALGSDPVDALSKPMAPAPGSDADADGLSDAFEATIGSNPALKDTDGDGAQDGWEYKGYGSDPLVIDTDGDIVTDGCEVASINSDTVTNPGDQALLAAEISRPVSASQKLANFDLNKDGVINPGDQAFQASKALPGKCPLVTPWP